ncbi:cupin domain-containing protein [Leucobacter komagatae]|uniref:Cupin n=1 Tax=Leucobacter komagatae TaxID=55969 RepID=A0A0D0IN83_9MICO|nr:cupin domain-containing protein [Leucobacter komagatae]KIP52557.1 cupin [Leucobacter komagatae]
MSNSQTVVLHDAANASLGSFEPKPTAVTEGLQEATLEIWEGGKTSTGLWASEVGTFTAERIGYSEICYFIEGSVTVEVEGEEPVKYGAGDVMVMPSGWKGIWHVHSPVRKHFTVIED